jgi:hypothetical protein
MLPTTMGDDGEALDVDEDVLELCAVELDELLQAAAASATTPMAAASCSVRTCLLDKVFSLARLFGFIRLCRGRGSRVVNSRVA